MSADNMAVDVDFRRTSGTVAHLPHAEEASPATLPFGLTSQSCTRTLRTDSATFTSAAEEVDLQPFPTDTISEEILHLILYHVLTEPDFGKNGKWASREEAKRDKAKFAQAHKVSTLYVWVSREGTLAESRAISSNMPRCTASSA